MSLRYSLGTDEITTYKVKCWEIKKKVKNIKVKDGGGVRHIVFSSDETRRMYYDELTSKGSNCI